MAKVFKLQAMGNSKGILAIPDHYTAIGIDHPRATDLERGLSTLDDGRFIVKAGTPYKSGASLIGYVFNDVDVTDGPATLAILTHGFLNKFALPEIQHADNSIQLFPLEIDAGIELIVEQHAVFTSYDVVGTERSIILSLNKGHFSDAANQVDKWETDAPAGIALKEAQLLGDKVKLTFITSAPIAPIDSSYEVWPNIAAIKGWMQAKKAIAVHRRSVNTQVEEWITLPLMFLGDISGYTSGIEVTGAVFTEAASNVANWEVVYTGINPQDIWIDSITITNYEQLGVDTYHAEFKYHLEGQLGDAGIIEVRPKPICLDPMFDITVLFEILEVS